jgi:AcrR family transcriptional regulator
MDRLLEAGKVLFADRGFSGTSVRKICDAAGTSATMIHHYFGSKQGLYDAIIEQFSSQSFEVPLRIIASSPRSREDFALRFEMFLTETFYALINHAPVFRIISRDQNEFLGLKTFHAGLAEFLNQSKKSGIIRAEIDVDMVTGLVLDRLGNQILYAGMLKDRSTPNVMSDEAYRKRWLAANIDVLIHAFLGGTNSS